MFAEALKYVTTPCPAHLRRMGYLSELIALDARLKRCRGAWEPHLTHTKNVVRDAIAQTPRKGKAVVLGAGILADIPLDDLAAAFDTVELIDICFLRKTERAATTRANVALVPTDITGLAAPLYDWATSSPHRAPVPAPKDDAVDLRDADLVVSANVLSQLPLVPLSFLRNKGIAIDETAFARRIVAHHLALLAVCPGTVCLIGETERLFSDGAHSLETEDPLWGVNIAMDGPSWIWELAPRPEASADFDVRNRVGSAIRPARNDASCAGSTS